MNFLSERGARCWSVALWSIACPFAIIGLLLANLREEKAFLLLSGLLATPLAISIGPGLGRYVPPIRAIILGWRLAKLSCVIWIVSSILWVRVSINGRNCCDFREGCVEDALILDPRIAARGWFLDVRFHPRLPRVFPNRSAIDKSCYYGDVLRTPLWPSAASFFIVSVLLAVLRYNRLPANLCLYCEYDLRGSPSGVCPECGQRAFAATVP